MRVMGIDPSARSTGVALPGGQLQTIAPCTTDPGRRLHLIAGGIRWLATRHQPDIALVEGPAPHAPGANAKETLAMVRGVVFLTLFELDIPVVIIGPSRLKRYATGSGNAPKRHMIHAAELLGYRPRNDDEADAAILQTLGQHAYGDAPDPAHAANDARLEVVAAITWPAAA